MTPQKRLISEPVSEIHYSADACVIWCFDDRFSHLLESLRRHEEFAFVDMVKVAGGARGLTRLGTDSEQAFLLDQIEKSIALHHTPIIGLMIHAGCGAYGKKFTHKDEETGFYQSQLAEAMQSLADFLEKKNLTARIVKFYADFEGLVEVV